ncbi:MAG TPA: hypothetical protein QGG18_03895 [Rhodospirillales bacterium]|jgi:hypothetical protein|nr:hypothetical protein [Rhodospirillales bacterium]
MLYELYQHLTTPRPRPIKEMGYLKELTDIDAAFLHYFFRITSFG